MKPDTKARLQVLPDAAALSRYVADWMLDMTLAKSGRFAVSLSGGSTPKQLYELLATPPYADRFPWDRVHWFWGDERFVPPDSEKSNFRMVREAMLSHVPVPPANIHALRTVGLSVEDAASAYEATLKTYYGANALEPGRPLFDLMLLGLGGDGHTASLFPNSPALTERTKWVVPVGGQAEPRITLTYPILESSAETAFLIEGDGKRAIFARVRAGDQSLPAARLKPIGGLTYVCDKAAMGDD